MYKSGNVKVPTQLTTENYLLPATSIESRLNSMRKAGIITKNNPLFDVKNFKEWRTAFEARPRVDEPVDQLRKKQRRA